MKTKDIKNTNKYVFTIERIGERPVTWEENHGLNYQMNKQMYGEGFVNRKTIKEIVWSREYEIKEEKVISILESLLKQP